MRTALFLGLALCAACGATDLTADDAAASDLTAGTSFDVLATLRAARADAGTSLRKPVPALLHGVPTNDAHTRWRWRWTFTESSQMDNHTFVRIEVAPGEERIVEKGTSQ